ncbi:hypothetical protein OGATHE_001366 [Ogataea polymorpha]|uniref:Secreted protein n=1 Tax=Ogataea polymorpha TaxID=460523 RepID=A0A9P8TFE6_9ASCO|nr:hypothetical protein OGATHE_001366 [Ogataea polymorpha]
MTVLKAVLMVLRGLRASPATMERYSGPTHTNPALAQAASHPSNLPRDPVVTYSANGEMLKFRKPNTSCCGFPPTITMNVKNNSPIARISLVIERMNSLSPYHLTVQILNAM